MKRASNLLTSVADIDNLRLAFWKAKKGKSNSREVNKFRSNLDLNLLDLQKQILSADVAVGSYRYFTIYEPKERKICASAFSEQVLHHALMNICHPHFERFQINTSYASRKDKGVHKALAQAKEYTKQYQYFLKLDIKKFFDTIHHQVLMQQLSRLFKDKGILKIFETIIHSYETTKQRGLPIGNLTSQYFANHYLAGLDHYIKEKLHIKAYIRYMDDMILWYQDIDELKDIAAEIERYINKKLQCEIKPSLLNNCDRGVPFLGFLIFPKVTRLLQKSKQRFFKKMRHIQEKYEQDMWTDLMCQVRINTLLSFIRYGSNVGFLSNKY